MIDILLKISIPVLVGMISSLTYQWIKHSRMKRWIMNTRDYVNLSELVTKEMILRLVIEKKFRHHDESDLDQMKTKVRLEVLLDQVIEEIESILDSKGITKSELLEKHQEQLYISQMSESSERSYIRSLVGVSMTYSELEIYLDA